MKSARGLTLIELMVALAVFAILGILSFRAVSAAVDRRDQLTAAFERWRSIGRFLLRVETDLQQIEARPGVRGGDATLTQTTVATGKRVEFSFLRGDGVAHQTRRYGYRFEGGRIFLLRWPGTDAQSTPRQDVLLDEVKNLRFRFYLTSGRISDAWPADSTPMDALPAAIDIDLELADAGTIRRLLPLR